MIRIIKHGILLEPTKLDFENEGVLNPATVQHGNSIFLYYRAVRQGNFSTIGYCDLTAPTKVGTRLNKPLLAPEFKYESKGLEDPRVVVIEGEYYLTYTAFDGVCAKGALATSSDGINFDKKGVIVAEIDFYTFRELAQKNGPLDEQYILFNMMNPRLWDKDLIFFPRRINGKLVILHRIKPDIQIVMVNDLSELTLDFWHDYFAHFQEHILLRPKYPHEKSYVGGGCPPIETPHGWLLIYHGVYETSHGYVYSGCAALLDLNDPRKEIARLPYPLIVPQKIWEIRGDVDNVCFPTGSVVEGDTLYIYYGAGDEVIAAGTIGLAELTDELLAHRKH
ncbi:pesticidal protein Cry7Aa [Chitinophaga silvatica]|uniref:Pesticidal protein Cry7Aa n=1 Tax=Chitinophaga silvatica TaxID=2282649 RepID=A0A3E1Y389_9BACT|nr:pesticidal protein Cry7Aa [Chitinophaga silvatica]RFS19169.1 pesticidal protein Cry7Aa [Chitinophaga silvatica]